MDGYFEGSQENNDEDLNMTELQNRLLDMLKWFDKYCRDHQLRYYAVGGTLLVAVRHHGFIPWDDDIDLALPRDDYNQLNELLGNKMEGKYFLETVDSEDKNYCYPYSKLYDTQSTLIENNRNQLKRGIFLDIFPFDGIGDDLSEGMRLFSKIQNHYNFYLTRIGGYRKGRSFYKNAAVFFSRCIPSLLVDDKQLRITLDKLCQTYRFESSDYVGNLLGNWRKREIFCRSVIGEPKEYQFEDMVLLGIERYDEYLSQIYGNWRQLPPKEKQVSQHDFILLNLKDSYLK